ncbi:MAG TPA: GAF domain-containing protein [Pirellulales bacterium]|nr:GAF domain-containing protein [Pirellulales bacterium]
MSSKPKLLYVSRLRDGQDARVAPLSDAFEIVHVQGPIRALAKLGRDDFAAIYVDAQHIDEALRIGKLLQNERILQGMPDGVVLLDSDNTVLWGNGRLREWIGRDNIAGSNFYAVLGSPEILGPDFCPFHTALATGSPSSSTLRSSDNHYYRVHAAPLIENDDPPKNLVVTIRDVTAEVLQEQKLAAIHQAGIELANLTPEELFAMTVEERIELLKSNILHYTRDLLNFNVVEIRLLDAKTGKLEPLLSEGLMPEATNRILYARPQNNGVTGFVAATGKSYLCEDTTEDPLYLAGAAGAKSSLTVPLVLHDEVIGTFNVESPEPRAFSESDLRFLEIFTRDVALALNTLELLVAEKASAAAESVEAIHSAVALPVDDILNDAVNIMERYIGHEPEVAERLQRILRNARDIKQVIQKVGQQMAPSQAHPQAMQVSERPLLRGLTVLVADADESVRSAAHNLLERYSCVVETAHDGGEAIFMIRNLSPGQAYDVVIADIRLPDMSGYEFMLKLQTVMEHVPLVLMTGFGYDPGHSIVKARQAGLPPGAVLYKPFRLDQLLDTIEQVVRSRAVEQA